MNNSRVATSSSQITNSHMLAFLLKTTYQALIALKAMQRAQEMLAGVPARMAEAEKNAREAWRAVQIQGTMAEGEAQLAAKDFGAALASFRKALALDPANAAIKRRVNAAARP